MFHAINLCAPPAAICRPNRLLFFSCRAGGDFVFAVSAVVANVVVVANDAVVAIVVVVAVNAVVANVAVVAIVIVIAIDTVGIIDNGGVFFLLTGVGIPSFTPPRAL